MGRLFLAGRLRPGSWAAACLSLCFAFPAVAANSHDGLWQDVSERGVARTNAARRIVPDAYRTVRLDRARFAQLLQRVPHERAQAAAGSPAVLELPMPDGRYAGFRIAESPVMEAGLAKRYPQIRTWVGQGIDDPDATARIDFTPAGFHAQVLSADGAVYVDPFQPGDQDHYIAYRKRDHRHGEAVRCSVTGQKLRDESPSKHAAHAAQAAQAKVSSGLTLRTYRLAMAATGEYTAFHGGGVADALAGIVTTVNRVNGIYEREVGVRMVLVADNDQVIFTNAATDPYANTSNDLAANINTLNARIGSANYDVGHLVGTGGGGVAYLGVICSGSKGGGLTGSPSPAGDSFDVDYVAHELGHQFSGNHTFNGSGENCAGGNREPTTAYEPGSGVTIQAYAGICAGDDLQPNSEDHFHRVSLDEILAHVGDEDNGGGRCGVVTATGNSIPTVTPAGASFAIPASTPFELSATGSDPDGDTLTYAWEQFDLGPANPAGSLADDGQRPIFRAFAPSRSGTRIFPSLRYILDNANVPPQTTNGFFTGEVLPSTDRNLLFKVTVRDNRAGGGGTNEASTAINVEPGTPFAVTAPNAAAVTWAAGSSQSVTWNVGSTTAAPISAANVRITLSLDGGYTWPVELAASEPNDGAATVTVPAGTPASTKARVKIKAVGNVFFDVSNFNFTVTGGNSVPVVTPTGSVGVRQGAPAATANVATLADNADAPGALAVAVSGVPPELSVSAANVNGTVALTAQASCALVAPSSGSKTYPVLLEATDSGNATGSAFVNVLVSANRAPTLGTYTGATIDRNTVTPFAAGAAPADADGNYSGISVSPTVLPGGGTVAVAANGTVTVTTTNTTTLGAHTIRVTAADGCGAVEVRQFVVTVTSTTPSLSLVANAVTSGNAVIEPNECNTLTISLANGGSVAATNAVATLSTATPNVTITQPVSALGDIPAGATRTTTVPFEVSTGNALLCLSDIDFDVSVSYGGGGGPYAASFSRQVGRPAALDYSFTASAGGTVPAGAALIAGSVADDALVSVTVPAGFSFSLYGNAVAGGTTLRASTNGTLQFTASGGSLEYDNGPLPNDGDINYETDTPFPANAPTLFAWWDDLATNVNGGGIYTSLTGSAPNRQWTIEWRGKHVDAGGNNVNIIAAMAFREGVDGFEFIYPQVGGGAFANGASATIGVQGGSAGPRFTQYSNQGSTPVTAGTRLVATRLPQLCSVGSGTCSVVPAVLLSPSGGSTAVAEGGATDSYDVVLATQPTGTVTVTLSPDADATTSVPSLTFTTLDWNVPKTVTVGAADDRIVEGAHAASIAHAALGGGYDAVAVPALAVNVADNDSATYRFAQASGSAAENAGTVQIAASLAFATAGTGAEALETAITVPVTANAAGTASAGSDYTLGTGSVTFPVNGAAQNVAVTLLATPVAEPSETLVLDLGTESGGSAAQQAVVTAGAPASHTLTLTDVDTAGVALQESAGDTQVAEGGAGDGYTLVLTSQPTASVTIAIAPGAELAVAPPSLTFTAANWNVAQGVTVTAIDDGEIEGAHAGTITHAATGGGYNAVVVPSLSVDIADNDTAVDLAVTTARLPGAVLAGGNVSFEVAAANLSTATDAAGANFAFALAPALLNVSWTCVADPGASCPASGNGLPAHAVTLPRDSGVLYTITGQVPAGTAAGTVFTGTASLAAPAGAGDTNPANDSASATATVEAVTSAIFANGFE